VTYENDDRVNGASLGKRPKVLRACVRGLDRRPAASNARSSPCALSRFRGSVRYSAIFWGLL
jgi:hypothetical protein